MFYKEEKKLKTPIWCSRPKKKRNKNPTIPKHLMFYLNIKFNNTTTSNFVLVFKFYSHIFM